MAKLLLATLPRDASLPELQKLQAELLGAFDDNRDQGEVLAKRLQHLGGSDVVLRSLFEAGEEVRVPLACHGGRIHVLPPWRLRLPTTRPNGRIPKYLAKLAWQANGPMFEKDWVRGANTGRAWRARQKDRERPRCSDAPGLSRLWRNVAELRRRGSNARWRMGGM
jgi:hypothetical protein